MNDSLDVSARLVRLARAGDRDAAHRLLPLAQRRGDARALRAAHAGLLRAAFEDAGAPVRLDLPGLAAASLSPDGPWLAVAGIDDTVLIYALSELRLVDRFATACGWPAALALAGDPSDGLLACLDSAGELNVFASPTWHPVKLSALAELDGIDEVRAVAGFDRPTLLVSTPNGGALVQRVDGGAPQPRLDLIWPATAGRLLAAHPEAGLAVASDEGLCIEAPDGTERRVASRDDRDRERLSFSHTGTRALWLRGGELTWLHFVAPDEPSWQVGAWTTRSGTTLDYFYGHDLLDIHGGSELAPAGAALLYRHEGHQLATWLWDAPGAEATVVEHLDDLDAAARARATDTLRFSGDGTALVGCALERGRVSVRELDGTWLADLDGFPSAWRRALTVSPDARHAVVCWEHHAYDDPFAEPCHSGHAMMSLQLLDVQRCVVAHTLVDQRLEPIELAVAFSPGGTLAVLPTTGAELWRLGDAQPVRVAAREVCDAMGAGTHLAWLDADRLAISAPERADARAIVLTSDGRRLGADEVGAAFVVPGDGIFAPDGTRLQRFERHGHTAVIGEAGTHVVEALPGGSWLVHTLVGTHSEVGALDVALHTGRIHRLLTADAGRTVVVMGLERNAPIEVLRWQADARQLRPIARLEGVRDVAASPAHPWLFTLAGDATVELRHTDAPDRVVSRLEAPTALDGFRGDPNTSALTAQGANGSIWMWRLTTGLPRSPDA